MKVYLSGSHSCGKSTLARYISETYKLPLLTETARQVLSEKELQLDTMRHDINLVNDYQMEVFKRQLLQEKDQDNFVCDRSFDGLAYAAQHSTIFSKIFNSPELKEYINNLKNNKSIIFFVRPSKATLKNDGVREHITWDGVIAIDAMIKLLFELFELPYFQISVDNMQERIRFIDNIINLYNK